MNAGVWNDYTGGVLNSAACGPMGADYQVGCWCFGLEVVTPPENEHFEAEKNPYPFDEKENHPNLFVSLLG